MRLAASLPVPPDLPACQRVAARAEALGYDSIWIADTGAGPDAFVLAAAVACVTCRLRIGTAVMPVYTRTPSVFAAGAGSVAPLAPGRFVLGLGASSETIVRAWGGVPFERYRGIAKVHGGALEKQRQLAAGCDDGGVQE